MAITWGDYNRDGHMDLYVSNMFSAAGNRITFQQQFKPGISSDVRSKIPRLARGNTLMKGSGDGMFYDVSTSSNVAMARCAWGNILVDLNNDGWQNLVVANGMITGQESGDL